MPYVGPRWRKEEGADESAKGSSGEGERRSPLRERERRRERYAEGEGSSTDTKGAAMKQTNTERAGRGCRGAKGGR